MTPAARRSSSPLEPAGALVFSHAEEERDGGGRQVAGVEALAQRAGEQVDEPLQSAPGRLERHLGADDPVAVAGDEAGLLEVVEAGADRGAGGRGGRGRRRSSCRTARTATGGHAALVLGRAAGRRATG